MTYYASVIIHHIPTGIQYQTIEESAPSHDEAKRQFEKLSEIIALMEKDNHSITLETTEGYTIFFKKFLSDSILRLKILVLED